MLCTNRAGLKSIALWLKPGLWSGFTFQTAHFTSGTIARRNAGGRCFPSQNEFIKRSARCPQRAWNWPISIHLSGALRATFPCVVMHKAIFGRKKQHFVPWDGQSVPAGFSFSAARFYSAFRFKTRHVIEQTVNSVGFDGVPWCG